MTPLDLPFSPGELARRLADLPGFLFFDTARLPASFSTMPAPALPFEWGEEPVSLLAARPGEVVTGRIENREQWGALEAKVATGTQAAGGFAAGWVEYDGAFCFGLYSGALLHRHRTGEWFALGTPGIPTAALSAPPEPGHSLPCPLAFRSALRREEFVGLVRRAQEYIAQGDIYQVNLAHRFAAPWPCGTDGAERADPFAFYAALRAASPAPHAAYLSLGNRRVLSSSPELFLKIDGDHIRTRPIKGTRPRRADPREDAQSARDLAASAKEAAELIMITDLERNDLGQVCEFGSVEVRELLKLEQYEQVFHLVSTVEGRLRPGLGAAAALRACFPGGSITGAPKKRAREIIAELEPAPRGLYTGAIGYFGPGGGAAQFNIAIRTVVIENGEAHFHVGAGIVADSDPEREWEETLDKAAGILLAAERFRSGAGNPGLREREDPA